jgi:hypothetical protein
MPKAFQELNNSQTIITLNLFKALTRFNKLSQNFLKQQGIRKFQMLRLDGKGIRVLSTIKSRAVNQIFMKQFNPSNLSKILNNCNGFGMQMMPQKITKNLLPGFLSSMPARSKQKATFFCISI